MAKQGLIVTGDNPYTLGYRDPRLGPGQQPQKGQHSVLIRWVIKKPDCMKVTVTPDESSVLKIKVKERITDPDGYITGYRDVEKSVPQKIKIQLECGECTCGRQFTATVEYHHYGYKDVQSAWCVGSKSFSIFCAGPDCKKDMIIDNVSYFIPEEQDLVVRLSQKKIDLLKAGKSIMIDPREGELG